MRGLWIDGPDGVGRTGGVRLREDLPAPEPLAGETRVSVLVAGVCATDLALSRGYMGFRGVPGHEFVGVAREGPHLGRRVVGEINAACGTCDTCARGRGRHCSQRTVLGILGRPGAFAEELRLPQGNLHPVPDDLPTEEAVFVEPLAAAFQVVEQVDPAAFERALVLGDGRLGLLCAQVLALRGLRVDLAGRHPERGDWLPGGIRHRGDVLAGDDRERWGLVVEATGDPRVLPAALARVEPRGTLVLKTTSEEPVSLDLAPVVVDEIRVVGSRCGPFAPAIEALAAGAVVTAPLVHARFPLAEAEAAFERAGRRGTLKVLVENL